MRHRGPDFTERLAAFTRRRHLRLRAGPYRMYTVEGDLITILRVDRRAD